MGGIIKSNHDPRMKVISCTADVTVNNSAVLVPVPTLNWTMEPGTKYAFSYFIWGTCNPAADWKINITGDATALGSFLLNCYQNRGLAAIAADANCNANGGNDIIEIAGVITTADGGTVVLSFAQLSAHASNCTIYANSKVIAWKL